MAGRPLLKHSVDCLISCGLILVLLKISCRVFKLTAQKNVILTNNLNIDERSNGIPVDVRVLFFGRRSAKSDAHCVIIVTRDSAQTHSNCSFLYTSNTKQQPNGYNQHMFLNRYSFSSVSGFSVLVITILVIAQSLAEIKQATNSVHESSISRCRLIVASP